VKLKFRVSFCYHYFKAVTICKSCEKACSLGNLKQWLSAALIALVCLFALLFIFASYDEPMQSFFILGGTLTSFFIAMLAIVRPVPYFISSDMTETNNRQGN